MNNLSRRHPVVGVGALILRPGGAFLIGHRIKQGEPASWCLPGGHLEPGESFEEAARREIAEETGIRVVNNLRVFTVMLNTGTDRPHVTAGVLAHVEDDSTVASTLEPDVFSSWVWATFNNLPDPLFPASAGLIALWNDTLLQPGWLSYPISAISPSSVREAQ